MNEPQTLDEVMTDEAEIHARMQDNLNVAARNALRAELREPLRALRESHDALRKLVERLDYVHAHPAYEGIWVSAHSHGIRYDGPTYTAELAEARAALKKAQAAAMEAQG